MLSAVLALAFVQAAPDASDQCKLDDEQRQLASTTESKQNLAYFRASIWPCEDDRLFYGNWFGKHLRAMGEPSFAAPEASKGYSKRFRLLVPPSFRPAYSIRVDYPPAGQARVTVVTETGSGGYGPGEKVPLWSNTLNEKGGERLADDVEEVRVLDRAVDAERETTDGHIMVCADGTHYVFEALDAGGTQRLISRHQCDLDGDRPMIELFHQMHRLGRLTVPYELFGGSGDRGREKADPGSSPG